MFAPATGAAFPMPLEDQVSNVNGQDATDGFAEAFTRRWRALVAPGGEDVEPHPSRLPSPWDQAQRLCSVGRLIGRDRGGTRGHQEELQRTAWYSPLALRTDQHVDQAIMRGQLLHVDRPFAASVLDRELRVVLLVGPAETAIAARSAASATRVSAWVERALLALMQQLLEDELAAHPLGLLWTAVSLIEAERRQWTGLKDRSSRERSQAAMHQLRALGAELRRLVDQLAAARPDARERARCRLTLQWLWSAVLHEPGEGVLRVIRPLLSLCRAHQLTRARRELARRWVSDGASVRDAARDPDAAPPLADGGTLPRPRRVWFRRFSAQTGERKIWLRRRWRRGGLWWDDPPTDGDPRALRSTSSPNREPWRLSAEQVAQMVLWGELREPNPLYERLDWAKAEVDRPSGSLPSVPQPRQLQLPLPQLSPVWAELLRLAQSSRYSRFTVAKARGGRRELEVPEPRLMAAQRRVARWLALAIAPTNPSCAFVPGRNVIVHASAHAGAVEAVQLDIENFFGSISPGQVVAALTPGRRAPPNHPMKRWSRGELRALVRLCVRKRGGRWSLPQGAPTSPALSNAAAAPMDHRIRASCNAAFGIGRWTYTRYADDIVLSTREALLDFAALAEAIVRAAITESRWRVNEAKVSRWAAGSGRALVVCGLTVGPAAQPVALSRDAARQARTAMSRAFDLRLPEGHRLRGGPRSPLLSREGKPLAYDKELFLALLRAEGALSWAYSATGDLRWLGPVSARVADLAAWSVGGEADRCRLHSIQGAELIIGWAGELAPRWAIS